MILNNLSLFNLCFAVTFLITIVVLLSIALVLYVTIRPFNKPLYRHILWYFIAITFGQVAFVVEWWASMKLRLFVNKDTFNKHIGKEHALLILNHSYDIDWIPMIVLSGRMNMIGNIKSFVKTGLKRIPIFGLCFILSEYIFLERSFEKDEKVIKESIDELAEYPYPLWILLYPEGTWFTKEAHMKSQEFAKEKKFPQLNHHLQPRTKGFVTVVNSMRGKIPAIYDIEIAFKRSTVKPSLFNILTGKSLVACVHINRIPIEEVPTNRVEQEEFLRQMFQEKDKLKDNFMKTGDFFTTSDLHRNECISIEKPLYLIVIFVTSALIILCPMIYYALSLLLAGEILSISIIFGVIVTCVSLLNNAIKNTEIAEETDEEELQKPHNLFT